jgi:hypothetical protein
MRPTARISAISSNRSEADIDVGLVLVTAGGLASNFAKMTSVSKKTRPTARRSEGQRKQKHLPARAPTRFQLKNTKRSAVDVVDDLNREIA